MRARKRITVPRLTVAIALAAAGSLAVGAMGANEHIPPATYMTTISSQDIPASFPPEAGELLVGAWQIEFTDNGIAFVTRDGELVVTTRYHTNPARLILQDQGGSLACLPPRAGVFAWALEQDVLTLAEVQDTCAGRALVLTAHPLQKLP
jgi:hypothetical protein